MRFIRRSLADKCAAEFRTSRGLGLPRHNTVQKNARPSLDTGHSHEVRDSWCCKGLLETCCRLAPAFGKKADNIPAPYAEASDIDLRGDWNAAETQVQHWFAGALE